METLGTLLDVISGKEFSVPLWEMILYIVIMSLFLLFGKYRMGLLTSYCFVFYWGYFSGMANIGDSMDIPAWGMTVYILSGFLMGIVAIVGFLVQGRD